MKITSSTSRKFDKLVTNVPVAEERDDHAERHHDDERHHAERDRHRLEPVHMLANDRIWNAPV